jgi:hypothetical protein
MIKHENYFQIAIAYQNFSIESAQAPAVILSSFPQNNDGIVFQCFVEAFCDGWSHKERRLSWDKSSLILEIMCTMNKHENYLQITIKTISIQKLAPLTWRHIRTSEHSTEFAH